MDYYYLFYKRKYLGSENGRFVVNSLARAEYRRCGFRLSLDFALDLL